MLKETKKIRPIIVFSVEKSNVTKKANAERTQHAENVLNWNSIPYRKVVGSYKGQIENGFIIEEKNFNYAVRDLVINQYSQESVLRINSENTGTLLYSTISSNVFEPERIGKLKSVAIGYALKNHESFTIAGNEAYIFE